MIFQTLFSIFDDINFQDKVKPLKLVLNMENRKVNFEIDTGSQHSVISKKFIILISEI